MLDLKRDGPDEIQKVCDNRGVKVDVPGLFKLHEEKLELQKEVEGLRAQANNIANSIKSAPADERKSLISEGASLKQKSKAAEERYTAVTATFEELAASLPNTYAEDTPLGGSDKDNVQVSVYGSAPVYSFKPKDHLELGKNLGMDLEAGARIAGSGFPLLKGAMAQMESAMLRFAYDKAIQGGFTPVSVPLMARTSVLKGIGF